MQGHVLVGATVCLINKLKKVKSSSKKCKKLHNCMLSHSWRTWTYPQAIFAWEGNVRWSRHSRGFLEGIKDSYSVEDYGNRDRFLMNSMRSFFKKSKKEDLGSSNLVSPTSEPRWRLWNKYS